MRSLIGSAIARLQGHDTQVEIAKRKLRGVAREFDELAKMSRANAESAKRDALRPGKLAASLIADGVGGLRPAIWQDWRRLNERSMALTELASAIRCELAVLHSPHEVKPFPQDQHDVTTDENILCAEIAREGEEFDSAEGPMRLSAEAFDELVEDQRKLIGLPTSVQNGKNIVRGPVLSDIRVTGRRGRRIAIMIAKIDAETDSDFAAAIKMQTNGTSAGDGVVGDGGEEADDG
jgi:hypothetical protein